ncbi:hypothetical protein BCR33DRAFT_137859 [Rhizoclosmatium globosum]|uniref:Uncharacterized protein n=1 Tax=Rhizoclosmatium globosum TaxID=329046 RepID=A0A1Y2AKJ9_9FUNG|nr:hypothetical protein BCR33DRAFT_137859 [Rhizoclosmatium globosum]|eukprot:ORY23071.1 hypothetical protein BCR33DRAFT_137859 [Rhizoclosmatium globosum]
MRTIPFSETVAPPIASHLNTDVKVTFIHKRPQTITKLLQSQSKATTEHLFQVSLVSMLPILFPPHELQKSTASVMQQQWFTKTSEPVYCVLACGGFGIPVLRALEKAVDVVGIRWVPVIPDLVARVVCSFGHATLLESYKSLLTAEDKLNGRGPL